MKKVAANYPAIFKALGAVAAGTAGTAAAYHLGEGMDYNPVEKVLSMAGGASSAALPFMKSKSMMAKILIPSMIASELAPAGLRAIRAAIENNKAQQKANEALSKWTSTAAIGGSIGLGALGLTVAPALYNISRAAERIGDGRALRMSTSIRKRPGDPNDLRIEMMTPDQADEAAKEEKLRLEKEQKQKQQQEPSMLGGLLG